jgi:hypothetical protein
MQFDGAGDLDALVRWPGAEARAMIFTASHPSAAM